MHLIKNEVFNTSNIQAIVLDEADKLLENGQMSRDVQSILKTVIGNNTNIQIIAATATVTKQFETEVKKYMKNPIGITPKHEIPVLLGIKQFAIELQEEPDNIKLMRNKICELEKIFAKITFKQCLLFTDSQSKTESYGNYLSKLGWKNEVINGSQMQEERLKVLKKLIKFKCRILISTDLMSRGIDIENINLVINLDLPYDCFTYLHRIGRGGRFGTHGIALTILNGEKDKDKFRNMLGEIGRNESMVYKFPSDETNYDFWDFNNKTQDEQLTTIYGIVNDENDNTLMNCSRIHDDIVDENLLLLEITKKLIDSNDDDDVKETSAFDTDALLAEYEQSCETDNDDNATVDNIQIQQKENGDDKDAQVNGSANNSEKSLPVDDQNDDNDDLKKLDQRRVIFVRNAHDDDDDSNDDSSVESDFNDVEGEDSKEEDVKDEQAGNEEASFRQNTTQNENNSTQEIYNEYVGHYYNQWRNTFYFQLANIQNYVNNQRDNIN